MEYTALRNRVNALAGIMMVKSKKIQVSERAIIGRINRVLRQDDRVLKTARSERTQLQVGSRWYVVNTRINGVVSHYKDRDLEDIATELEVLKDWEEIAS